MALFRTRSAAVFGIDAHPIDVEVDTYPEGMKRVMLTVGLPDSSVRESRERVKSALINSGFGFTSKSMTISLAPADMKKEGAGFDLAIAMAILGAMGTVPVADNHMFIGELGLDGMVRPVRGALSIAVCALQRGVKNLVVPVENVAEASVADGVQVFGVRHVTDVVDLLQQNSPLPMTLPDLHVDMLRVESELERLDMRDVRGQSSAKRALMVAAAGNHNVLMIGPPGSGKTMLAKRFPTILPPPTFDEALETTKIHSVAGLLPAGSGLLRQRPFRSPHHTISDAGLVGGGSGTPRPGEVSLAHHGVLFLDELPEFPRNVLELLRQPLEGHSVTIARSTRTLSFPANFMLVAAMNPCPCGFYSDPTRECRCTGALVQRYLGKLSGPLLDRIDLHIEVPVVPYAELRGKDDGATSAEIRERVIEARTVQQQRGFYNSDIPTRQLRAVCRLDEVGERTLETAVRRMSLSARAHDRILKVARTIADLGGSGSIEAKHLAEAIQYRSLDRDYWG